MLGRFLDVWKCRNREITLKNVVKRIWHFPGLCKIFLNVEILSLKGASIGRFSVILKCIVHGDKRKFIVGEDCSIVGANISLHDSVIIEDHVVVNPGVVILTASHGISDPEWKHKMAPVVLKKYCWVATGAMILPGVTIGEGAVVGAGCVVRSDVPDFTVVTGNPAKESKVERVKELKYSPTAHVAQYEAWLG